MHRYSVFADPVRLPYAHQMAFAKGAEVVAANDPQGKRVGVVVKQLPSHVVEGHQAQETEHIEMYLVEWDVDGHKVQEPAPAVNLRARPAGGRHGGGKQPGP